MATETLNINGISEGWTGASGSATDIDEAVGSADGSEYGPGGEADSATFDLSATSGDITDDVTVEQINITVRLRDAGTAGNEQCNVDFLIGGSVQGSAAGTGNLTASFADYGPLNDAGWNSDWTKAELDGAQVRLTPTQSGKPGTNAQYVDCVDVVITYTAGGGIPLFMHHYTKNVG